MLLVQPSTIIHAHFYAYHEHDTIMLGTLKHRRTQLRSAAAETTTVARTRAMRTEKTNYMPKIASGVDGSRRGRTGWPVLVAAIAMAAARCVRSLTWAVVRQREGGEKQHTSGRRSLPSTCSVAP